MVLSRTKLDKAIDMVKNGFINNVPLDFIMIMSGLDEEEIELIKSNTKFN